MESSHENAGLELRQAGSSNTVVLEIHSKTDIVTYSHRRISSNVVL